MEINYQVVYQEHVIKKHIPALSTKVKQLIKTAIETRLTVDPFTFGKPLRYSLKGHRRLRISNYRVVYKIENQMVVIIAIKHRKYIYQA